MVKKNLFIYLIFILLMGNTFATENPKMYFHSYEEEDTSPSVTIYKGNNLIIVSPLKTNEVMISIKDCTRDSLTTFVMPIKFYVDLSPHFFQQIDISADELDLNLIVELIINYLNHGIFFDAEYTQEGSVLIYTLSFNEDFFKEVIETEKELKKLNVSNPRKAAITAVVNNNRDLVNNLFLDILDPFFDESPQDYIDFIYNATGYEIYGY